MTIVNGYCTAEQLVDWNRAITPEAGPKVDRAINAASRAIDQHCQRHFYQVAAPRVFDTCDQNLLDLGVFGDLVTVNTLAVDTDADGVHETVWAAADYQLLPLRPSAAPEQEPYRQIAAVGGQAFPVHVPPARRGLIQVTGVWGWPTVPEPVVQACLLLAARVFNRKESPQGVAGWGEFGAFRVRNSDPDVIELLAPYQLAPLQVA